MEARTTLPLDIVLYIIDLLADGGGVLGIRSLRALSQACKSMVTLCRKYLFSRLYLGSESRFERFSSLLSKNPDIVCYVRSLSCGVWNSITSIDHELIVLDMLKESSSLQSIELSSWGSLYCQWNYLPESIRSSLVSLIELPTVTHLYFNGFKGFPATVFSGCSNLNHLQLNSVEMTSYEVYQVISHSKIPTPVSLFINPKNYGIAAFLNSASLHAGGPIVDFSRLQKAKFKSVVSRDDIGQAYELIKVPTRLEHLNIDTSKSSE